MSIYILLQINFAINNNKSLPSFTIQFQFQFSTRHFLTEVGSQGWKGAQKAAAAAWNRGEGLWLIGVTSQGYTQVCLPSKPTFWVYKEAQTGALHSAGGGERPEYCSGGNSPGGLCLAIGNLPRGP